MSLISNNEFQGFLSHYKQVLDTQGKDFTPKHKDVPTLWGAAKHMMGLQPTQPMDARTEWLDRSRNVADCGKDFFQKIEELKKGHRSENVKDELLEHLGEKNADIAKKAQRLEGLATWSGPIIKLAALTIACLFALEAYRDPNKIDYPDGDPLLTMSAKGKGIFIGTILGSIPVIFGLGSVIGKKIQRVFLENRFRNDSQFVEFVNKFQLSCTNMEEAARISTLFEEAKWVGEEVQQLEKNNPFTSQAEARDCSFESLLIK